MKTNITTFDPFSWNTLGFDSVFKNLETIQESFKDVLPKWPPYNIKKTAANTYVLEMALAGFGKNDVEITLDGNKLTIEGKIKSEDEKSDSDEFFYKGIAERAFKRSFSVADKIEISNAEMVNGMLKIFLESFAEVPVPAKKISIK